jgi:hypothetical protein
MTSLPGPEESRERVRAAVAPPTSEKEPLPKAASTFLHDVATRRGLDGLE